MNILLGSILMLLFSGILALALGRFARLANYTGSIGAAAGCALGLVALIFKFHELNLPFSFAWPVPYGTFIVSADALSALFLFPIFILSGAAALSGVEFLKHYYHEKNIGAAWFFFNLLIASMILVVTAGNAVLFILSWELMSISSFFLVLFEGEKKTSARAGLVYLIATHIGTFFLLIMFIMLDKYSGSFDFAVWKNTVSGSTASLIFICAFIGFGTKAGFMPLHIWLPEAHPAAPSHVSAVMSGVMIKTGIYGLVRVLTFLGVPCAWWGYLLIVSGIMSGVLGVLFALAQHDLKRLLAYHSIENIGIISLGLGLGVLGISLHNPLMAVLGFSGGLLHVVNHAFFKGLLFLGAGVVLHETGTREIDVLGGLLKKMPFTAVCFLIGSAAICGLPPLNGFVSEFLIYFTAFKNLFAGPITVLISCAVILSLALIGGLAAACFAKVFGIVFLGEPRSEHCRKAHEPGILTRFSLGVLTFGCFVIGISAPLVINSFGAVVLNVTGLSLPVIDPEISAVLRPLRLISVLAFCLYGAVLLIALLRRLLLRRRRVEQSLTWDCGYAEPSARMQYTASSFAQPVVDFFSGILRTQKPRLKIEEYFPGKISFKTETADVFGEKLFRPLHDLIHRLAGKFTWIQHGQLQFYILYILLALVALFVWKL